jgi:hypothetical protein
MGRTAKFGTALFLVLLSASAARSQTIEIKAIDTSAAGKLVISVTITTPAKWAVNSVPCQARPPNGGKGEGGQVNLTRTLGTDQDGQWSGTISSGIKSGNAYDVQAIMTVTDDTGKQRMFYSQVTAGVKVK